jgi:hypothetical protein
LPVADQNRLNDPCPVGGDLVHDLHGFDDADGLANVDFVALRYERLGTGGRRSIKGADHRSRDQDLGRVGFG